MTATNRAANPAIKPKPIPLAAVEWTGDNFVDVETTIVRDIQGGANKTLIVPSRDGPLTVYPGMWIVRDAKSHAIAVLEPALFQALRSR
jgi:hypothetical protein